MAEKSGWAATARSAEVRTFVENLAAEGAHSHSHRLATSVYGLSEQKQPLMLVIASDSPPVQELAAIQASSKLRILVNANIHGGEVEGKEAVQILLREIAQGGHAPLLEHCILLFSVCCNPDGNDRLSVSNRVDQNGPAGGART